MMTALFETLIVGFILATAALSVARKKSRTKRKVSESGGLPLREVTEPSLRGVRVARTRKINKLESYENLIVKKAETAPKRS